MNQSIENITKDQERGFAVSPHSPFKDAYCVESNFLLLKPKLEQDDLPDDDPDYPAILEYYSRKEQLDQINKRAKSRQFANEVVPDDIASKRSGSFHISVDLELHAADSQKLLLGRHGNSQKGIEHTTGIILFSIVAGDLYRKTALGNPFINWMLIQIDQRIKAAQTWFEKNQVLMMGQVNSLKKSGFSVTIATADDPIVHKGIQFSNPYAMAACHLLTLFDQYARYCKTLNFSGLVNNGTTVTNLARGMNKIRSVTELGYRSIRILHKHPELELVSSKNFADLREKHIKTFPRFSAIPEDVVTLSQLPDFFVTSARKKAG